MNIPALECEVSVFGADDTESLKDAWCALKSAPSNSVHYGSSAFWAASLCLRVEMLGQFFNSLQCLREFRKSAHIPLNGSLLVRAVATES